MRDIAIHRRDLVAVMLAAGLSLRVSVRAFADADHERAHLAALLHQLDVLDRLAQQSALSAPNSGRYHFDFARLRSDIARMRAGIEDYLSPRRAQPRDPTELSGDYRREELVP
jgi:RAQPRD family integrative conjugative element protein